MMSHDKMTQMSMRLGNAIIKAVDEHGPDNSFSLSELVGSKDAMYAGKALRKHWITMCLNIASRRSDFTVQFSGGRIHVVSR